jgi:hypothetical protein
MPHSRQLAASVFASVDKAESQPMKLSAKAEDAKAVVANTAAVKVTRILMVSSLQCDLRPIFWGDATGAGA